MFKFGHPLLLSLFILIPIIILLYFIAFYKKQKQLQQFGDLEILSQLMPEFSKNRPVFKLVILLLALSFFILGIAAPQFGSKMQQKKHKGVEIIIALDVSNSMMAQDIKPNRLERAKQAISQLVDQLKNDKIGLIVFAGEAFTQLPITNDYVSAKMFLSTISTKSVSVQGTAIGDAIRLASKSFTPVGNGTGDKAIIIITDGENHEDDPISEAKKAVENGIHVNTIGVGLAQGAPIPIGNGGLQNFMKDESGNVVVSKLDENLLQQIAAEGKGAYIRATNSQLGLNTIFKEINKMNKTTYEAVNYSEYDDQYQWPFAIAFILLLFELLILERKTKWSEKFNLFQIKKEQL